MTPFAQVALVVAIYNLAILAGTAYLVAFQGWSGWWFLLALVFCKSVSECDCDKAKESEAA
ncbi:MAG: hypothetical protein ACK5PG_06065 [Lysobacterales bacterium]|jgi:hypothetical protein